MPTKNDIKQLKLAAKQGNVDSQFKLGAMYYRGEGVPQNYDTALKWCTLAAEQGNVLAQFFLGGIYYDKNYELVIKWFKACPVRKAARKARKLNIRDQLGILCVIYPLFPCLNPPL